MKNVLEKILEEIRDKCEELSNKHWGDDERHLIGKGMQVMYIQAEKIIRSHMDEVPDANASNKRLIDANTLDEEVRNFFLAITGNPKQATVVKECKESFRRMIDEQPTVYEANDWIPVEEKLPEESGYYLAQLSKKLPNEDYSDRVVVLYDGTEKEFMCYAKLIIAWQPLPETYKDGRER